MSVNFFNWLRDGVKQSVLLGVSDAIETLGSPADPKSMHPDIVALMKGSDENSSCAGHIASGTLPNRKKRLGRSLRDLEAKPEASA